MFVDADPSEELLAFALWGQPVRYELPQRDPYQTDPPFLGSLDTEQTRLSRSLQILPTVLPTWQEHNVRLLAPPLKLEETWKRLEQPWRLTSLHRCVEMEYYRELPDRFDVQSER